MDLLADFTVLQIAVAIVTALVAAFIRGLAGFGLAILLVPILAFAMTPVEAVLVTNVVALLIGLSEIARIMREAEKSAWTIGLLVVLATWPGLYLLSITPTALARLLIALIALSAFFAMFLPQRPAEQPGPVQTGLVGISSGLLTGFAGMPGPPVVPYYLGRAIPKEVAKPSMLLIFTIAAAAGLGSGAAIGVMDWSIVALGALLFPAVLIGNYFGAKAFGKVSDTVWRSFVMLVLGATAMAALLPVLSA
ncbi:sulfite exporter TauE/SafE family protein [Pontixanthobacter aquaemixtae]|uniref:Probable membrane transporter protein n=1 Tax=Pontixanthobacter aquaemixtae TaxID=1958940 RepID=A0A844ZUA7_9SPHN|nr:sulfite exporter TauE/SafE family protein [Pontixanthobacter aquaemixtae]MXO91553.1 TSUP family transporter [Pontixanthobacter aquaemixtae]